MGISPASNHHREKAVRAYRGMLPRDLECGPLYHADQILQREVITVSASDEAASAWRNLYLLALARYVVLNPLKAGGVKWLESWPWSSYLATCGQAPAPAWLQTDWILAQFGRQRASAIRKYVQFVHDGARLPSVWVGQSRLG
ncbi:MAG: hypothetical protein WBN85_07765 [Candidatus Macondimonas sp.]